MNPHALARNLHSLQISYDTYCTFEANIVGLGIPIDSHTNNKLPCAQRHRMKFVDDLVTCLNKYGAPKSPNRAHPCIAHVEHLISLCHDFNNNINVDPTNTTTTNVLPLPPSVVANLG